MLEEKNIDFANIGEEAKDVLNKLEQWYQANAGIEQLKSAEIFRLCKDNASVINRHGNKRQKCPSNPLKQMLARVGFVDELRLVMEPVQKALACRAACCSLECDGHFTVGRCYRGDASGYQKAVLDLANSVFPHSVKQIPSSAASVAALQSMLLDEIPPLPSGQALASWAGGASFVSVDLADREEGNAETDAPVMQSLAANDGFRRKIYALKTNMTDAIDVRASIHNMNGDVGPVGVIVSTFAGWLYALVCNADNKSLKLPREWRGLSLTYGDGRVTADRVKKITAAFTNQPGIHDMELPVANQDLPEWEAFKHWLHEQVSSYDDFVNVQAKARKAVNHDREYEPCQYSLIKIWNKESNDYANALKQGERMLKSIYDSGTRPMDDFKPDAQKMKGIYFDVDEEVFKEATLEEVLMLRLFMQRSLVIVGDAGDGKSTYAETLAYETCKEMHVANPLVTHYIQGEGDCLDNLGPLTMAGQTMKAGAVVFGDVPMLSDRGKLLKTNDFKAIFNPEVNGCFPAWHYQAMLPADTLRIWT